jgi:hypothetical protein
MIERIRRRLTFRSSDGGDDDLAACGIDFNRRDVKAGALGGA